MVFSPIQLFIYAHCFTVIIILLSSISFLVEAKYTMLSENDRISCQPHPGGSFEGYASGLFEKDFFVPPFYRQNDEMPIGWPLGLGFLNTRLGNVESIPAATGGSYSLHVPSISFSSFSSSNLDTESTASFFQDKSVSLGRLIGIRPGQRGRLYFPNSLRFEEKEKKILAKVSYSGASKVQQVEMSRGICIPTLLHALLKISKSKKSQRTST